MGSSGNAEYMGKEDENSENYSTENIQKVVVSRSTAKLKDPSKSTNVGSINLYFGCRDENYYADGTLTNLNVAFSRKKGQKKTYVQDLILKDGSYLTDLILNQNAHVYICGDAKAMAPAVKKSF